MFKLRSELKWDEVSKKIIGKFMDISEEKVEVTTKERRNAAAKKGLGKKVQLGKKIGGGPAPPPGKLIAINIYLNISI